MKIRSIDFPTELIEAIRRENLVVFAGAGVSMGPPAELPSFAGLAESIGEETNQPRINSEPEDRFFGRLFEKGHRVHELVAGLLRKAPGSHTSLHRDLLRLFKNGPKVRVVTTNFDTLFEDASSSLFDESIKVYTSPALPLGHDFSGIVHVHGSCVETDGMVLTDADFGRAYLIEGWARRFLLDMFRTHAVLFVGYSHDDVVMHYLSRALPAADTAKRFALVADASNFDDWLFRGIRPVSYAKKSKDDYGALNDGVKALADYVSQNILDRRKSLVAIASGMPPSDDEAVDQVLDALAEESTTRFITQAAREPAWISWFDSRHLLDPLFSQRDLTPIDELLGRWLTDNFVLEQPDELILLLSGHQVRLSPFLWDLIGSKIGLNEDFEVDKAHLSRWVSLLLHTMPEQPYPYVLMRLGECCASLREINSLLLIFDRLLSHRLEIKKRLPWPDEAEDETPAIELDVELSSLSDDWELDQVYTTYIRPLLQDIAPQVLNIAVRELEMMNSFLTAWGQANKDWDPTSYRRSAIEPHEQDEIRCAEDTLIDAARDSLVTIGEMNPGTSDGWLDILCRSQSFLVRRLFVHALSERRDKSAEEKLRFFLDRHSLHDVQAHHEIYRLIASLYPALPEKGRSDLITVILSYEWPDRDDKRFAERTAWNHYDWLQWLVDADPKCDLAVAARDKVLAEHPGWQPREHPDFTHWAGPVRTGPSSPYTVEQLIGMSPSEWVENLLVFKGDEFFGPDRDGLRLTVRDAARKDLRWGLDLAEELAKRSEWSTDLWGALLLSWEGWSANEGECLSILKWLKIEDLWENNLYNVISLLHSLVRDGGKGCAALILEEANETARALWSRAELDQDIPESRNDWLQMAINRSAGILAEYWLESIQIWRKKQEPKPEALSEYYRTVLSEMIHSKSKALGMALTILSSQLAFMLYVDYEWTKTNLVKYFDPDNDSRSFQQAWDGFLGWGRLNSLVVEEIGPYFEKALTRLDRELASHRDRFIEYLAFIICFLVPDPREGWIPAFFRFATPDDRKIFASQIERFLRGMNADQQREQWERWIKSYWEKRLQGIPEPLAGGEIAKMVEWAPRLEPVFNQVVDLVIQMHPAEFHHSSIVRDLTKGNFIAQYPEPSVNLLIYLLKCQSPVYFWHGYKDITSQLDREKVSEALMRQLDEMMVAKGLG